MVALSQTPAAVHLFANTVTTLGEAGEAISPGMPVYLKSSDQKYYQTINTGLAEAACVGIAISYAPAAGDSFEFASTGSIDMGATMIVGENYIVGAVGAVDPEADIATGEFVTTIGRAETAGELILAIKASNIAHA